jgi:hypothetical protein
MLAIGACSNQGEADHRLSNEASSVKLDCMRLSHAGSSCMHCAPPSYNGNRATFVYTQLLLLFDAASGGTVPCDTQSIDMPRLKATSDDSSQ